MAIIYTGNGGGVERKTAHIFASNADASDVTEFGSTLAGVTQYTTDLDDIQNAAYEIGWRDAVISNKNYPLLADMNGVMLTFSQQIAYLLQHGSCAWDSATTYYAYDLVNENGILYVCTSDENVGNNPTTLNGWAVFYDPDKMANVDLSNLSEIGEAKLNRPVPFSVNSGEISDNITIPSYNYTPVGAIINTDGVLSGFSSSSYATFPSTVSLGTKDFEMVFKIKPNASSIGVVAIAQSGYQFNTRFGATPTSIHFAARSSSGQSEAINRTVSTTISTSVFTYIKITRSGNNFAISSKEVGDADYTELETFTSSASIQDMTNMGVFLDSGSPGWQVSDGVIDLNGSYIEIDGAMFWEGISNIPAGSEPNCLKLPAGSSTVITRNFIQPILTANGTMGGDSFAVEQSSTLSSYYAYKMFDNNASTEAVADYSNAYFTFYNPNPLNVTAIAITNDSDSRRAIQTCKVSVSNDGTTFTDIYTYSDGSTGSQTWTIDLSSNTGYYNYYRVTALTTGGYPYGIIQTNITATEQITVLGDSNIIFDGSTVPVVYTNAYSTTNKFTEQQNLDVSTFADGTYNIFASITDATLTGYANTIYRQSAAPLSPSANDVWLNTSVRPLSAWIYDGTAWQEFTDVPIGSCEVTSGAATSVKTFPYNYTEKFLVSDACMPSSRSETLTLGASGASYTAPANGWLFLDKRAGFSNAYINIYNNTSGIFDTRHAPGSTNHCTACVPALKGDVLNVFYDATGNTDFFCFIYAEGAKEEA